MKSKNVDILHKIFLVFSCSILFFLTSAHAICVPRNSDLPNLAPSSSHTAPVSSPDAQPAITPSPETNPAPISQISAPTSSFRNHFTDTKTQSVDDNGSESKPSTLDSDSDSGVNSELKKICSTTDYPALCVSTITPLFNGKTDIISILEMAIMASTQQTKQVMASAVKMASAPSTPAATASTLQDCKDNYNDALDNLKSATQAIPALDTGTINSMLSAVVTAYSNCDDEFMGANPLSSFNARLSNMASNCLAIASLIKT